MNVLRAHPIAIQKKTYGHDENCSRNGKVYHNVEDLENGIHKIWDEVEIALITDLVKSSPKRLIQVVEGKGGPTKSY